MTATKPIETGGSAMRPAFRRRAILTAAAAWLLGRSATSFDLLAQGKEDAGNKHPMDRNPRLFSFVGSDQGPWRITAIKAVSGDPLPAAARLAMSPGGAGVPAGASWALHGVTSNERYVTRPEKERLLAVQPALGRPESTCAALIPIRKSARWWAMTQDERRTVFETQSHHTQIGLEYLPAIARRLHHCRDLADPEPFDFLTWFEFAPGDGPDFDRLLAKLRASEEWKYVEREVEIRAVRADPA